MTNSKFHMVAPITMCETICVLLPIQSDLVAKVLSDL